MSESIQSIAIANAIERKNFSSSIAIDKLSSKEVDQILDHYPQLVEEKFRGYFVNRLKEIGKHKFIQLADRAIKYGNNPQKMFNHLLK